MRKQILTTATVLAVAIPAGTAHAAPSTTRPAPVTTTTAGTLHPLGSPFYASKPRSCPSKYVCKGANTWIPGASPWYRSLCDRIPCARLTPKGKAEIQKLTQKLDDKGYKSTVHIGKDFVSGAVGMLVIVGAVIWCVEGAPDGGRSSIARYCRGY